MAAKKVKIGKVAIGAGEDIAVQSMLCVPSYDISGSVRQAKELEMAGCDIIRIAIPDIEAVRLISALKEAVEIPIVADIHFDYRLAVMAAEQGVDKIRINPGNIGAPERVKAVADICSKKNIPIRIGVNSGSLEKDILAKYSSPTAQAMIESAARHIELLHNADFDNIVLSIKSSNLSQMVSAYRFAYERFDCPLHLGVTEAGTEKLGVIKSAIGIGSLLLDGIGDTIRVSLTDDPVKEVYAAKDILKALGKRGCGVQLISCPTCGRTRIDLISLAKKVEEALKDYRCDITVAVMGCAVNGPGEAREADVGIAGGDGCAVIFQKGEIVERVSEQEALEALLKKVKEICDVKQR